MRKTVSDSHKAWNHKDNHRDYEYDFIPEFANRTPSIQALSRAQGIPEKKSRSAEQDKEAQVEKFQFQSRQFYPERSEEKMNENKDKSHYYWNIRGMKFMRYALFSLFCFFYRHLIPCIAIIPQSAIVA